MKVQQILITNRDFVLVGQQAWDLQIGSNCKDIAVELARHNRVLYVNPPLDRYSKLYHGVSKIVKKNHYRTRPKQKISKIAPNLWQLDAGCLLESINWIKNQQLFDRGNKINGRRYAISIHQAIEELGFRDIILFNDNDIFRSFYLVDFLQPKVSVYYSRDYLAGIPYWKHHGQVLEPKLIAKNSICAANSQYLAEYCAKFNARSYFVGQGCNVSLSLKNTQLEHNSPGTFKAPVIGYVGALVSDRLNIGLLKFIANALPDCTIALIGPEDDVFKASDLHRLANVHFTGLIKVDEVAAYISALDVCINPQLLNAVTIGNYPRKVDEYLLLGKPVVAMQTQAMAMFANVVYLANGEQEFLAQIKKALTENNRQKQQERTVFAAAHTWENSLQKIYTAIADYENEIAWNAEKQPIKEAS